MIRIVIADDQELIRESLKIILSTHKDVEIVGVAADGFEVLDILKHNEADIILMDIQMPVLNGIDAAKEIRRLEREDAKIIPIVAVSANVYTEDVAASNNAGMNAHLSKPISFNELQKVFNKLIKKNK